MKSTVNSLIRVLTRVSILLFSVRCAFQVNFRLFAQ